MTEIKIDASYVKALHKTLVMLERKSARGGVPPKGAQTAAKRGLELRQEFGRGGTMVGVARARDISNGRNLSESTVRRMKAYFDRHEVDKQGKDWDNNERPSNGKIAWLLWGGDAGRTWATMLVERWNREDGKKSLPIWLPNGEEITRLDELAAMMNIDRKTAAYYVLEEKSPHPFLLTEAEFETKVRRVRTPDGARKFGQPIGSVIVSDVVPDVIPDIDIEQLRIRPLNSDLVVNIAYKEDSLPVEDLIPLAPFPITPKDMADEFPIVEFENDTEAVDNWLSNYDDDDWADEDSAEFIFSSIFGSLRNSSVAITNAKKMVQHRIARRIYDRYSGKSADSEMLREEIDNRLPNYNRYDDILDKWLYTNNVDSESKPSMEELEVKLNVLKELGLADKELSLDEVLEENHPYRKWMMKEATAKETFNSEENLNSLRRYSLIANLFGRDTIVYTGLSNKPEKWLLEIGYHKESGSIKDISDYDEYTNAELIIRQETKMLVGTWANTSADRDEDSISMQYLAKNMFKLEDGTVSHLSFEEDDALSKVDDIYFKAAFLQAMYEDTQEFFKEQNLESIELYRGIVLPEDFVQFDMGIDISSDEDEIAEKMDEKFREEADDAISDIFNDSFGNIVKSYSSDLYISKQDFPDYEDIKNDRTVFGEYFREIFDDFINGESREPMRRKRIFSEIIDYVSINPPWYYQESMWKSYIAKTDEEGRMDEEDFFDKIKDPEFAKEYFPDAMALFMPEVIFTMWDEDDAKESLSIDGKAAKEDVEVISQPLSSWSISRDTASAFATQTVESDYKNVILKSRIPVERIISTPFTGIGCLNEQEFVVVGGDINATAWIRGNNGIWED